MTPKADDRCMRGRATVIREDGAIEIPLSLGLIEGILAIEECFELDIPDEDAEQWRTVGDVADYIETALV